jgi:transcription antitermination factor NusG
MDRQGTQRVDSVSGAFRAPRFGRPDPMREPDAYMHWLVTEPEQPRAPGELVKLPWIEDIYTIGPVAAPPERRWFVVVTEPAKEGSVCGDLGRAGVETFSPKRKSFRKRAARSEAKMIVITRPLLPRYVFAGLVAPAGVISTVDACRHAVDVLYCSGAPAQIDAGEIEALRTREAVGEFDETVSVKKGWGRAGAQGPYAWVVIGAGVRVTKGSFAMFTGVVEEVDGGRSIAKVAVSIFGRLTPINLEFTQFEEL